VVHADDFTDRAVVFTIKGARLELLRWAPGLCPPCIRVNRPTHSNRPTCTGWAVFYARAFVGICDAPLGSHFDHGARERSRTARRKARGDAVDIAPFDAAQGA